MKQDAFIETLNASRGIVCAAGAGGKKSLLYAIARRHAGRVALTATVPLASPPADLTSEVVMGGPEAVETAARRNRLAVYAGPLKTPDRYNGADPQIIADLHRRCGFDASLVKADGARMRGLKAPRDGEPNFPPRVDTVLSVASIQVLGHPLDERWVHRPERVAAVTGARAGETLTTAHLARLLASPEGALKGVGGAPVIPVINKVDDGRWAEQARKTARQALAMTARFDRVVLTALNRDEPLVECVYRDAYPRA